MLKFLRNRKTAKKVWIVLALIIVPAFIFWGAGSLTSDSKESGVVGRINGRSVSIRQFKDAVAAVRNMAMMQFGDHYADVKEYLALESQAWDRLLLLSEAKRRRIRVSDRDVVENIAKNPYFARKGSFDQRQYQEMLTYVFQTQPRVFEEQTRQNLMLAALFKELTAGVTASEADVRAEYVRINEAYSVNYAYAKSSDFTGSVSPSDGELKAYYEQNPVRFKRPPSYNLDYVEIEPAGNLQELAQDAARQMPLEQLAKNYNLQVKETGWFFQNEPIPGVGWTPEVLIALTRLKIGQLTNPVQSGKKYYVFRIKDRKDALIPVFNDAADKVKEAFIAEEAAKAARAKLSACREQLAARGGMLEEAAFLETARSCGLKTGTSAEFKFGADIEGLGDSKFFWAAASKLQDNAISDVLETPEAFYVLRLKKRLPIDEAAFAKEKAEFGERVLNIKQEEAFSAFVEDLRKRSREKTRGNRGSREPRKRRKKARQDSS